MTSQVNSLLILLENGDNTPRTEEAKPLKSGFKKTGFFNEKMDKDRKGEDDTYESPSCSQNLEICETEDNRFENHAGVRELKAEKAQITA